MGKRSIILISLLLYNIFIMDSPAQEASPYIVSRLPVNLSSYSEISPVITGNGIMFCSDRRISGVTDRTSFDNRRLYNIYLSEKKDSLTWIKPGLLKNERSSQFNIGPMCISADGETVYFTSEVETGEMARSRKFRNHSGIFIGHLSGMQITSIQPFRYNSNQYDLGQPSVSKDGKYLFFASDMPGGEGGSDIWMCQLLNGEWSEPVNPGPGINSASTDNYPYIHPSGRLYFSSNRPGGKGGLDVYSSDSVDGSWDDPVRLPEPVNSAADDFAFAASQDLRDGYFASNRRRNDDIYEFRTTIIRKSTCNQLEINNFCYEFIEENAVKYDSIPFRYDWSFGDGNRASGPVVEHCYASPGKYLVQLDVTNLVTNETAVNEKSQLLIVEEIEQPYISCPDIAGVDKNLRFSADSTNLPGWDISQYYWNFDDETTAVGSNVMKSFRKPGTYNIQLIVTSKPGNDGIKKETCVSKNISIISEP